MTAIPASHGEGVQLLRYVNGQKYEPHTDYFHDAVNKDANHGGQRIATMLMYLSTPEAGGETVFPHVPAPEGRDPAEWSACARQGNAVKAVRGSALFFYSLHPDATDDVKSTHGSCPTLAGTKWSATKWMHVQPFDIDRAMGMAKGCADSHPNCAEWAVAGECKTNPGYMLQTCRKSCNVCKDAAMGRKGMA